MKNLTILAKTIECPRRKGSCVEPTNPSSEYIQCGGIGEISI